MEAKRHLYAKFDEEEKVEGCSQSLYSTYSLENGLKLEDKPKDGFSTLLEGWENAAKSFPDNNWLGHVEDNKYVWRTYKEAHTEAQALAKYLHSESMIQETKVNDKKFWLMGLYSRNRPEWAITNWAIMHFSGTVVTLYNTLGEESLKYAFDHTELSIVGCDRASFEKLLNFKKEGSIKTLKIVIWFDDFTPEEKSSFEDVGVQVHSFKDLVEKGKKLDNKLLDGMTKPTPDSTEVIWFTSGTTGVPKGAMICHRNHTANIRGAEDNEFYIDEKDTIISYLPLAHCYEKWLMALSLSRGTAIGYFRGNPLTLIQDIQMLKPTVLPAVPRVLTKLYDTINMIMGKEEFKHKLFKVALKQKLHNIKTKVKFTHCFWDAVLFKYIKAIVGGRVRFMLTGSAPISSEILNFMKCVLWVPIVEGYGQTETNAPVTTTNINDPESGHVGGPFTCCRFKIEDIDEMEYLSSDKPYPRGELCIKGPVVFQGYYKNPEKNEEAFDKDGWLHTGDVVEVWQNGTIKLIDRKKNLFKLSQGEYISPEKLENVYNKSQFVAQIFVTGDSLKNYIVAVIVPDADFIKMWATKMGITKEGDELLKSKEFLDTLKADLEDKAKSANLNSLEKIKKFHISTSMFSVDNNLLTPSMKLMRFSAKKVFKDIVDQLYMTE